MRTANGQKGGKVRDHSWG